MARLKLSPDVLAENPGFAAEQRKGRAVTESGIGHGHTDDATADRYVRPDAKPILLHHMRYTFQMMEVWGQSWEGTEAKTVRAAIRNYLERMERVS